eukprot:7298113-Ditylum_brightwellii.AAC.1
MEALHISTKWAGGVDPKNPIKVVNIFKKTRDTKEIVKAHIDLVWADRAHRSVSTPKYFKTFITKPTNDATLIAPRNQRRLKHTMLGLLLWNSLTPKFQLEMLTKETLFNMGDDYDGLLLWYLIVEKVNLTTNISVTNLKDKVESTKLDDFEQDIKGFNTWFADKRNTIIREV